METFQQAVRQYWAQHPEFAAEARTEGVDVDGDQLPVKAVLFDMDGVLFDSMPAHAQSWARVCEEEGLPMTEVEVFLNEGRTAFSTINMLTQRHHHRDTTPEEVERIYARKCEAFNAFPEAPKMKGAEDTLRQVKGDGLVIVVVTGSGQASLLSRLTTHYPGYFAPERVVSSKDVEHGKPHPEPYLMGLDKAAAALGLDAPLRPWEVVVVENAPLGVRAAVAAEIFTIVANTGPLPETALTDERANLLFPSMVALAENWPFLRQCFGRSEK